MLNRRSLFGFLPAFPIFALFGSKQALANPNGLPVLAETTNIAELFEGVEFEPSNSSLPTSFIWQKRSILVWLPEHLKVDHTNFPYYGEIRLIHYYNFGSSQIRYEKTENSIQRGPLNVQFNFDGLFS